MHLLRSYCIIPLVFSFWKLFEVSNRNLFYFIHVCKNNFDCSHHRYMVEFSGEFREIVHSQLKLWWDFRLTDGNWLKANFKHLYTGVSNTRLVCPLKESMDGILGQQLSSSRSFTPQKHRFRYWWIESWLRRMLSLCYFMKHVRSPVQPLTCI